LQTFYDVYNKHKNKYAPVSPSGTQKMWERFVDEETKCG
jgi:hypothetical protein